jgi:hypothetical protein
VEGYLSTLRPEKREAPMRTRAGPNITTGGILGAQHDALSEVLLTD